MNASSLTSPPPTPVVTGPPPAAPAPRELVNPWPGMAFYTENEREYFFGRDRECAELLRLIQRDTLTVLFGRSGLGKTSLLRAGVMPKLRQAGFFPVVMRLDYSAQAHHSVEQVKAFISDAALTAGVHVENMPGSVSEVELWELFHALEFWSPRNDPLTPVLIFDQFEEVFTIGRSGPIASEFLQQLADLAENRMPQSVQNRLNEKREKLAFDPKSLNYKVVVSLREDFVHKLDSLRSILPAIMGNRFALDPLDGERALAVVLGAGCEFVTEEVARQIVAVVAGGGEVQDRPFAFHPEAEIAPAYLSVICHELFRRMVALGRSVITADLVTAEQGGILEGLYERSFEGLAVKTRLFVEDRLVHASGSRAIVPFAEAESESVPPRDLEILVDRRLLRFENRLGERHVELSHDLLTRIVQQHRDRRRAAQALERERQRLEMLRAEQANRRRHWIHAGLVCAPVFTLAAIWIFHFLFIQEHSNYYRAVGKRNGFPNGIGAITQSEAGHLATSYQLFHQGIAWPAWTHLSKPAFRMMAVNGRREPTTNHTFGPFLLRMQFGTKIQQVDKLHEKGARVGLKAVCQWEFVANTKGEIIYERGLDREGRLVYGLIYSPSGSGPASTRVTHFVGPDGFPQLQPGYPAAYVVTHFNSDGFEDHIDYRDEDNLPAIGPDGVFGMNIRYNQRGQRTFLFSLDAEGRPMIRSAGNCGAEIKYNERGWANEFRSIGTDLKLKAQKDRPAISRIVYDDYGRRSRLTYYGVNEEPALHADGNHGWTGQYDENGNETQTTYIGLDQKPTLIADGYAIVKSAFDNHGNKTRVSFYNEKGGPVLHRFGNHGWKAQYDAQGNEIETTYIGVDGQPILVADGYAIVKSAYDARGNRIGLSCYGVNGQPVLNKDGNHGWKRQYDERGYEIETTFIGLDSQPMDSTNGYATVRIKHNARGNETEWACFNAQDKPAVDNATGVHLIRRVYDARGNETQSAGFDAADKPTIDKATGVHLIRRLYDEHNKLVESRSFGVDGKALGGPPP